MGQTHTFHPQYCSSFWCLNNITTCWKGFLCHWAEKVLDRHCSYSGRLILLWLCWCYLKVSKDAEWYLVRLYEMPRRDKAVVFDALEWGQAPRQLDLISWHWIVTFGCIDLNNFQDFNETYFFIIYLLFQTFSSLLCWIVGLPVDVQQFFCMFGWPNLQWLYKLSIWLQLINWKSNTEQCLCFYHK